jgi:hypothetical protein
LSNTKNVDRLTSETSDSPSVVIGVSVGRCDGTSAVGATAADAPPAIASDIPAAPQAGKATFERFRFAGCLARAIKRVLPASNMIHADDLGLDQTR